MSQDLSPAVAGNDVPPEMFCGFCNRPIQGQFYRTLNRFACTSCVAQVQAAIERNVMTPDVLVKAAAVGLVVGLACAAAWAVIVQVTHFEIGIIASFIGVAVGKAVLGASGRRRGRPLQWIAAVLSAFSVAVGKLTLIGWQLADLLRRDGRPSDPSSVLHVLKMLVMKKTTLVFSGFDLLWMAFAVFSAWRLCKAPAINIAGPFAAPASGASGLQFNTVEPLPAPAPEQA